MSRLYPPRECGARTLGGQNIVVEAKIRFRHRGCFTERLTGALGGAQLSGARDEDVFAIHAAHLPDADPHVATLRLARDGAPAELTPTPGALVIRIGGPTHAPGARIASAGCSIVWPALFAGGEEIYSVLAPSHDALRAAVDALAPLGSVRVEGIGDAKPDRLRVNVPLADITTALTQRQLVVLQHAIAEGYYESPRRTSTEALATTFGVTRSTLEEHLRKAERRVLEGFAGVLTAQPVLARAAARRPGRPVAIPQAR